MKAVLYTEDMEPITIIDLPAEVHRFRWDKYRVPVIDDIPFPWEPITLEHLRTVAIRTVDIEIRPLRMGGKLYPLFIVNERDLENALRLTPGWLPGQVGEVQRKDKMIHELIGMLIKVMER